MHRITGKRAGALLAVLALLGAACNGGGGGAPAGGSFSIALITDPEFLTPTNTNETNGAEVLNALFTGLVDYDPETSEPVNALAESIETEDQQNWTIKIKSGYTFHDGTEVTAQSFVNSWNYGAYGPNAQGNSYFFENVQGYDELQCPPAPEGSEEAPECNDETVAAKEMSGLSAPDATTISVVLKEPFSQYPITLGYTAFYPMPDVAFTDIEKFNEEPIGNGPFKMTGVWDHDVAINVERYEEYKGDPAQSDAIEFRIYADLQTAYNDLIAGELDIMDSLPPEEVEAAEETFGDRFLRRPSSNFTYLGFPLYDPAFESVELRQAFSQAIDRQAIIDAVYPGRKPATGVVGPVVAGFRDDACGELCKFDAEAAKAKFDAAGGYEGTLTLWFNSGGGHDEWVEAVGNQLRTNLGITDVQFESLEFAEYLELLDNEEITGPFRLGWVMDYPSPQNYLQPIYGTTGSSNNFGYSNAEVDRLIAEGNAAADVEAGIAKYNEAEDLILQDMPNIPMFFNEVQAAYSENVEGVVIDAFLRTNSADITVVGGDEG